MNCSNDKCLCDTMCSIGGCILEHELFSNHKKGVLFKIKGTPKELREKVIIELLQGFKPPKVNGLQIQNYNRLRNMGINIDGKKIQKNILLHHKKLGGKAARKKVNKLIGGIKSDQTRKRRDDKKHRAKIVSDFLKKDGIDARLLPKEEKKLVYTEAAKKADHQLWLEQYRAEPEPNFHYE